MKKETLVQHQNFIDNSSRRTITGDISDGIKKVIDETLINLLFMHAMKGEREYLYRHVRKTSIGIR